MYEFTLIKNVYTAEEVKEAMEKSYMAGQSGDIMNIELTDPTLNTGDSIE